MSILTALLAIMIVHGSGLVYNYNLTVTLENGASVLHWDDPCSPFSILLNQNVFKNVSGQVVKIESVRFGGSEGSWAVSYDLDGNPFVRINASNDLAPFERETVELLFTISIDRGLPEISVERVGSLSEIPSGLREAYPLMGIWDLSRLEDSEELIRVADSIRGGEENVLLIVKHLVEWFETNMVYASNNTSPQSVWETYSSKSGDCDDQSNLFVLFCRMYGIPAYTAIGPIFIPGQVQDEIDQNLRFKTENAGWHGWAMVYLPLREGGGVWIPVDLTYFRGAYAQDGHIKSQDYLQHITGAALYYRDTAVFIEYLNLDHISEYDRMREILVSSDCTWTEFHGMYPASISTFPSPLLSLALVILGAASALIIMRYRIRERKSQGGIQSERCKLGNFSGLGHNLGAGVTKPMTSGL